MSISIIIGVQLVKATYFQLDQKGYKVRLITEFRKTTLIRLIGALSVIEF